MISRRDFAIQSAAALSLSLPGLDRFAIAEEPGLSQKHLAWDMFSNIPMPTTISSIAPTILN